MPRPTISPGDPLSPQEKAILLLAVHGGSRYIAKMMNISPLTVKTHKYRMSIKLGTHGLAADTFVLTLATAFRTGLMKDVSPLAAPTEEHWAYRRVNPYTIRHPDGQTQVMRTWPPHRSDT